MAYSSQSSCLILPGIADMHHHAQLKTWILRSSSQPYMASSWPSIMGHRSMLASLLAALTTLALLHSLTGQAHPQSLSPLSFCSLKYIIPWGCQPAPAAINLFSGWSTASSEKKEQPVSGGVMGTISYCYMLHSTLKLFNYLQDYCISPFGSTDFSLSFMDVFSLLHLVNIFCDWIVILLCCKHWR